MQADDHQGGLVFMSDRAGGESGPGDSQPHGPGGHVVQHQPEVLVSLAGVKLALDPVEISLAPAMTRIKDNET